MAYVVGSVSVEVVPDFRNAQNAITAFFNKQKDGIEVPVKPVFDENSKDVENQAARLGSRVSKAMNDAAARNQSAADRLALQMAEGAEKAKLKAHAEALRINAQMDRDAAREQKAILDLGEAIAAGRDKARLQAHAEALRINERMDREAVRVEIAIERDAARERKRVSDEAAKAKIEAERLVSRTLKEIADDRIRAEREAEREAARARQQAQREELNFARRSASAINAAIKQGLADRRARVQVEIDEKKALEDSRRTGGLITRAVEQEIHQNAGLISAAIGGALIAGAPAAIAAASTLFFGIGAVAVAQNEVIRSSWVGLWNEIKSGAVSDARVLVPTFQRMAGAIGQSFQRMRPLLQDAFTAVGPQIQMFTASLLQTAENALPALVRAVEAGGPVIKGLGDLMESLGTGIGGFFDELSQGAPAAGGAVTELGRTMEELLPLFGELLTIGAETATVVLPALTTAFSAVHSIVGALDGVLPQLLTGFLAFRVIDGVARKFSDWSASLGYASLQGGRLSGVQGRLAGALSATSRALPFVGAAVGVVAAAFAESAQRAADFRDALLKGGDAADTAYRQMANPSFWDKFLFNLTHWGNTEEVATRQTRDAEQAMHDYLQTLDPVSQAQAILARETADVSTAIEKHGINSVNTQVAMQIYQAAVRRLTAAQEALQTATLGVTDAMVAQGDAARGLADASFAHEQALIDLETAAADYKTTMEDTEATELDRRQALLDLQTAYQAVGDTARDVALNSMPALLDANQKNILADKAQLDALLALKEQYGDLGPVLENQIAELTASTSGANANMLAQAQLAEALAQVGISAESIPGTKSVKVDALTDEAKDALIALGFDVEELDDGSFKVTADTAEAEANLDKIDTELDGLNDAAPAPTVDLNAIPFFSALDGVLTSTGDLDDENPTPEADLGSDAFNQSYLNIMGSVDTLHLQRPTPVAQLNNVPLLNGVGQAIANLVSLGGQRPTPISNLNNIPLIGAVAAAIGQTNNLGRQRPTPVANLTDNATPIVGRIIAAINSIPPSRSSTVTVNYVTKYTTIGARPTLGGPAIAAPAEGGAFEGGAYFKKMAFGGAVTGRGGPWDDIIPVLASNGEHMFDAGDVAALGGQRATFDFRQMLHSGALGSPPVGDNIRRMVEHGNDPAAPASSTRDVKIYTMDNPRAIVRAMRDEQQQHDALALPASWGG
jgi:hypothetical protein